MQKHAKKCNVVALRALRDGCVHADVPAALTALAVSATRRRRWSWRRLQRRKPATLQLEPAGLRFPSADAYDESDDGVLAIAGRLETADGAQVAFSASVAVDGSARSEVNLPAAVEKMSVQARLPFGGDASAIGQRRFRFTVTAGQGDGPVADRLRVWEHSDTSTTLAAVGLPGEGPVVVEPSTASSETAA